MTSIFSPRSLDESQVITVQDCSTLECPVVSDVFGTLIRSIQGRLSAPTGQGASVPVDWHTPNLIRSIAVLSHSTYSENLPYCATNACDILHATEQWGRTSSNEEPVASSDYSTATTTTSAALFTAFTGVLLDKRVAPAGTLIAEGEQPFGYFINIKVADNISAVELTDNFSATSIVRVNLSVDDCREISIFVPVRSTRIHLANHAEPTQPMSYVYQAPAYGNPVIEANAVTAHRALSVRVFDTTGAQVVSPIATRVWRMWPTMKLAAVLAGGVGQTVITPGASDLFPLPFTSNNRS